MEFSDWVNKITLSEILFLPAIFHWNNPPPPQKKMFTVPFFSNLFICYYWLKSDDVSPCADTNLLLF